jgi:hypothetical protein
MGIMEDIFGINTAEQVTAAALFHRTIRKARTGEAEVFKVAGKVGKAGGGFYQYKGQGIPAQIAVNGAEPANGYGKALGGQGFTDPSLTFCFCGMFIAHGFILVLINLCFFLFRS